MNEARTTQMNEHTNIPSLGVWHLYTGTQCRHTPACAVCTCTSRLRCTRCVRSGGQARRPCEQSQRYSEEAILKQHKTQAHKRTEGHTHKLTGEHTCSTQAWTHGCPHIQTPSLGHTHTQSRNAHMNTYTQLHACPPSGLCH